MKPIYAIAVAFTLVSILALSAFILHVRSVEESNYAAWNSTLNSVRLDANSLERAMLEKRIIYSSSYDEISELSQSVYADIKRLEALHLEKSTLLQPRANVGAQSLIETLKEFRNAVFDFNAEVSTLRSASNVFYNTTAELAKIATQENKPQFALLLFNLESSLLVDQDTSLEDKKGIANQYIARLESDFPEVIQANPSLWLSITNDTSMILRHSQYLIEIGAEETLIREKLEDQLSASFSLLELSRQQTRMPQAIASVLLITELILLAMFFLMRSSKLSKELRKHADELENIVALRTQALEMTMEDLQTSTAEKEEIAEELRIAHRLEAIGQLAAGIAHEINTPSQFVNDNLQFILDAHKDLARVRTSYSEAVKHFNPTGEGSKLLEDIQELEDEIDLEFLEEEVPSALKNSLEGMERISKIVKSMKDFSHPGSEGRGLVDLNEAIDTTLSVARSEWKYIAEIEKEFDQNLPQAPVFASELNQVLLNIIVNAAHAIEQKNAEIGSEELGHIRIQTAFDDDYVEVLIRDSGCGIPQENIDRVFDPFFTTKEVGKGTGQGLSIARKIVVDTHGGLLNVTSEVGQFSEFHIRLPRSLENSESTKDQDDVKPNEGSEIIEP